VLELLGSSGGIVRNCIQKDGASRIAAINAQTWVHAKAKSVAARPPDLLWPNAAETEEHT
jgi:hypothetical protein